MTTENPTPDNNSRDEMFTLHMAHQSYEKGSKNKTVTWLLWLFLGWLGGHRYYLGDTKQAIFMTIAGCIAWFPGAVWQIIDAFQVNKRIREINQAKWGNVVALYKVPATPAPESAQ